MATADDGIIDTVVFDVGNVLIEWDPAHLYGKLIPDPAERTRFLREVCTSDWNLAQDRGLTWASAVAERVGRFPEHADLIRAFSDRWHEMVPGAIERSVACLTTLKAAGVPVFAITNFSAEKWDECLERFPFLTTFDGAVVSAHERVVKPDPAIYRILFDRYGVDPTRAVFLDDTAVNVRASEAQGMRAILFTPETDPAAELRALGLPV